LRVSNRSRTQMVTVAAATSASRLAFRAVNAYDCLLHKRFDPDRPRVEVTIA
jgi:hypothetical protein